MTSREGSERETFKEIGRSYKKNSDRENKGEFSKLYAFYKSTNLHRQKK